EVTEVTTTEIVEETVEETEVTEGKKPKSKKNRKPKRKPTAGTTEAETTETETTEVTEVTEVTTETVEVTEEVPATTEETTEVTEVTTETIEVTDVKPEETTEVTEVTTTEIVEETVEETEVTEGKKPKSKKNRKPKRKPTAGTTEAETTETTEVTEVTSDTTLISSSTKEEADEDGAAGATVKTEVFRTTGANGSIITKTVRTTIRKVITSSGVVKRMIEVQTTTVTKTASGETSTAVETETREEIDDDSRATTSDATLISSSTKEEADEDGAAGATVKTEVFRTTGANGSIITKTVRTTIRKVITSSGVVKRMIEVQTTTVTKTASGETSTAVETETREEIDDDSRATTSDATLISSSTKEEADEDGAAGATVKTEVFRTTGANGSIITKTVRTTIRKVITSSGVVKRMIEVQTTTVTKTASGETSTAVETETREENDVEFVGLINIASVVGTDGSKRSVMESNWEEKSAVLMDQRTAKGSALWDMKRRRLVKTWLPHFVSYVQRRGRSLSKAMPRKELLNFARDFCDQNFVSFEDGFFNTGTYEEKRATWTIARSLSFHYPGVAVQQLGLGVGKFQRTLLIDEVCRTRNGPDGTPLMEVEFVLSALQVVPKKCAYYEDVLILENGEVLFHGTGESLITYFQELGFVCAADVKVSDYLLNLTEEQQIHHQVTMIQGFNNQRQLRRSRMFSGLMKFADDMVLITGGPGAGVQSRTSTPVGSPVRSGSTARLSTSYSPLRRQLKARGSLIRSPFGSPISSPAGFMSPQSTNATRSMKITAYSSPESKKTTKSMSSSGAGFASPLVTKTTRGAAQTTTYASPVRTQSTAMAGSTTTRKITIEGDFTVITTEVTSPRGTKRVSTTRQPTKSGSSTTAA
ncbi:hypothetical protein PC112_g21085, partial [Phytophthora cactorum]